MIEALLKRYKNPPDKEPAALELVLEQMQVISEEWARQELGDQIQATALSLWFNIQLSLTCIDDQRLATGRNQRQISGSIQRRFVGYPPATKASFFSQNGR